MYYKLVIFHNIYQNNLEHIILIDEKRTQTSKNQKVAMETWTDNMGICYPMHMHTTEIPILTSCICKPTLQVNNLYVRVGLPFLCKQYYDITSIRISLMKSKISVVCICMG